MLLFVKIKQEIINNYGNAGKQTQELYRVNNTDGSHGGNIKGTLTANKEYAQNRNERGKEY